MTPTLAATESGECARDSPRSSFLVLRGPDWSREHASLTFVYESEVLDVNADDNRVVQVTIWHRGGEHAVAGESVVPTA